MNLYFTKHLLQRLPILRRLFHGYDSWMIFDAPIVLVAYLLALLGRSATAAVDLAVGAGFSLFVVAAYILANKLFGVYRRYWSYAASHDAIALFAAALAATTAVLAIDLLLASRPLPVSVVLVGGFFALAGQLAIRYRRRILFGVYWSLRNSLFGILHEGTTTLILGAGESGQALAFKLQSPRFSQTYRLVGFLDDNPVKVDKIIHGLSVLGRCDEVVSIVQRYQVDLIVIAIHNIDQDRLRHLVDLCMQTDAQIRFAPDPVYSINGGLNLPALREVTIEDLLGRPPHVVETGRIHTLLGGRRVLVTGACGSIGSELVRQVLAYSPARLILLDNNESQMHDLVSELKMQYPEHLAQSELRPIVGDVTLAGQIERLFVTERPEIVLHAAAYKHVLWMEDHPLQAIRVNVLGTRNLYEASQRHGVKRFIFISTDKAVDPTSVMGASKRLCELLVLGTPPVPYSNGHGHSNGSGGRIGELRCAVVRFGNVVGSRGSVVPTFTRQIAEGGPVTITDPRMRRYFMSISEAVSLVLVAAALTEGRDLFMLEMGEEVSILDLAQRMIRLRGLRPDIDIPIQITGMRPGEKLSETLLGDGESSIPTDHPGIYRVQTSVAVDAQHLAQLVAEMAEGVAAYDDHAVDLLWSALCTAAPVSAFQPDPVGEPVV